MEQQILLIEDDNALGRGVAVALTEPGRIFTLARDLQEGKSRWEQQSFDLVVLDLNLPDGSGLDFLRWLRQRSQTPVLILTANDLESDEVAGLTLGADDYVTKPFSLAVLRARVSNLLRRRTQPEEIFTDPPFAFDFARMQFSRDGVPVALSRTEQRLLRLLTENRGHTLTREQLLEKVWDGGEFVDENALSVAVKRLRDKLTDAPIKTVYGLGYTWEVR